MAPVFAHGRLRLYLLKLLDEAPRHGYEVIRLLEERFQGLYAPSAGTVYPRLAKLEAEGLVTHTTEGGRKVYAITEAGRAELARRSGELAELELEIRESVAELAAEIRDDVRGAAGDLRREMRAAATRARQSSGPGQEHEKAASSEKETWRVAKEELRRAKLEWKEQARRAKDESRRAREETQQAKRQAKEAQEAAWEQAREARTQAQEEVQRIARRVQDQVQSHFARGDWPAGVRDGITELTKEFSRSGWPFSGSSPTGHGPTGTEWEDEQGADTPRAPGAASASPAEGPRDAAPGDGGRWFVKDEVPVDRIPATDDLDVTYQPSWAHETSSGDAARDLDRLLDRFRDDVRDTARDHGVTDEQLREARRHLSTAAAHIGSLLRSPTK
ncbi:PadR family transcriptional regulator [Streptomyces tsukubensis]|uniref:PadR family transcriptional regulator n=1 Tax=Streptomyces tsukubensis TaxID=83656 RepID=A0A1V4ACL7_9ACTN|nr:PadR family transcriptional regulator [Streptomyces tsukubensis]OON81203.1 PadR family transcriptional regulator [Streptomyces tsukubensis]QFR95685.1 PadR family transcriptional regulator [Streptomyces tsukubensis]